MYGDKVNLVYPSLMLLETCDITYAVNKVVVDRPITNLTFDNIRL